MNYKKTLACRVCILVAIAIITLMGPAYADCTLSDIEILSFTSRWDNTGWLHFNGEIKNNCTTVTGVRLRLDIRDTNGKLVTSSKFWPASVNNIPPGDTETIEELFPPDEVGGGEKFTIRAIEVKKW